MRVTDTNSGFDAFEQQARILERTGRMKVDMPFGGERILFVLNDLTVGEGKMVKAGVEAAGAVCSDQLGGHMVFNDSLHLEDVIAASIPADHLGKVLSFMAENGADPTPNERTLRYQDRELLATQNWHYQEGGKYTGYYLLESDMDPGKIIDFRNAMARRLQAPMMADAGRFTGNSQYTEVPCYVVVDAQRIISLGNMIRPLHHYLRERKSPTGPAGIRIYSTG